MTEKIFDIIPPEKAQRKRRTVPEPSPTSHWGKVLVVGVIIVILAAVFSYFSFREAEVAIRPRTETIETEQTVSVDENATTSDFSQAIIPGKTVSVETKTSKQFSASEKTRERKAQGTLRVYNEANRPVTLVANSRFMSASQKVYRANSRMRVPAGGHTDVGVTAAEPGQEYNVKDSKFSIPGLDGTALYTKMYAETLTEISGGFKGVSYQVTEQGLEQAESNLTKELKKKNRSKLNNNYTIIPESFSHEVTESFPSAEPGMETENFTYQVAMKTKALAFERQDLRQLVKEVVQEEAGNREVYDPGLSIDFEVDQLNLEENQALIRVDFSAKVYSPVDKNKIKTDITGKSLAEVRPQLKEEIEGKVEIKTRPYWMRSLPSDPDKINLEVIIE